MKTRNILLFALLAVVASIILIPDVEAARYTQNYSASSTFTAPYNGTSTETWVTVEVWGGGGGGGGAQANNNRGGGGGGGGAYSRSTISLTPGQTYNFTVGTGGPGTSSGTATTGGTSWFNSSSTINASGGIGGLSGSASGGVIGTGGAGGNIAQSFGQFEYSGGNGGNGIVTGGSAGGGGGGSGGNQTNGTNGGNGAVGSAGTGGAGGSFMGGAGGAAFWSAGTTGTGIAGTIPGGGGGGGFSNSGSAATGGAGANGLVRITYDTSIVNVNIYDESNASLITGTNITISISNANYTTTTSTTTGTATITSLRDGEYTFAFTGGSYSQRQYVVTVANNNQQTLNAYLSNGSQVILTFVDINTGQPVEGAITSMARVISGNWTTVEARLSGPDGRSAFTYQTSTQYRFITTLTGYDTSSFILSPILFNAYTIRLTPEVTAQNEEGDYAGVGIAYGPRVFYNQATNNLTFQITSPEGLLTSYTLNLTYPGGTNATSGVNSYGESFLLGFTPNAASILETVNITYSYTTTVGGTHDFIVSYPLQGSFGNYTFINSASEDYGMGDFEKVLLATMFVMFVWGMVTMYAGSTAGAGVGMLIMGYFAWIGFIPFLLFLISALAGFSLLTWRSTQ